MQEYEGICENHKRPWNLEQQNPILNMMHYDRILRKQLLILRLGQNEEKRCVQHDLYAQHYVKDLCESRLNAETSQIIQPMPFK